MKRPRFTVRGLMVLVALVGVGLYARSVYRNYLWYRDMASMNKRHMAELQRLIDIDQAEIARRHESLKALNREIESLEDPEKKSEMKIESIFWEKMMRIEEESVAEEKRAMAEDEAEYRRYTYLSSHPWIVEDPDRVEEEYEVGDDPDLPPVPTPSPDP